MNFFLVQVIVGGLLLGAVYALFSSGLTLVWGMMNIVNFAHGDFVMLGMYAAFVVFSLFGVGPAVGAPAAGPTPNSENTTKAAYMPSMTKSPWAKFTMFIMPQTSVSPEENSA